MHLPSGSLFCTSCTKTLVINTFASCILVTPLGQFLHQYCRIVWYETTAICATVRMSVSNKDFIASGKLCYITYKFFSHWILHSGWCSVDVSTDDIITHSDSESIVNVIRVWLVWSDNPSAVAVLFWFEPISISNVVQSLLVHGCITTLSSRCFLLVCESGVYLITLQIRLFSLLFSDNTSCYSVVSHM